MGIISKGSCNKIAKTWTQNSHWNWIGFSSNISHQSMIKLTGIVSRTKIKRYKLQKSKRLTLNSWLRTYKTNDDQMLILCLSYFITTVGKVSISVSGKWISCPFKKLSIFQLSVSSGGFCEMHHASNLNMYPTYQNISIKI